METTDNRRSGPEGAAPEAPRSLFHTTHWSVVMNARDPGSAESAAALEALCAAYWYPLYALARGRGHSPPDAEDLVQEFFARLLAKDYLRAADPERGRFRAFLSVAMERFLANQWDRAQARKRGGGAAHIPLDTALAERLYRQEPSASAATATAFDRHWAVTLLARVLARLEAEQQNTGLPFATYRRFLEVGEPAASYREAAQALGQSETAVRMAVHRLRRRFRLLFREEISQTLSRPEDVDEEIRHLLGVLAG